VNKNTNPCPAKTTQCGKFFILDGVDFPTVPRRPASGARTPWRLGSRFVGLSPKGDPLTNGEVETVDRGLWCEVAPPGKLEISLREINFVICSVKNPHCTYSGYQFHAPTASLRPESVCFDRSEVLIFGKIVGSSGTQGYPTSRLESSIELALAGKVDLLSMCGLTAVFQPKCELDVGEWDKLGYQCFGDGVTRPVLKVTVPNIAPGLLLNTHDVPAVLKAFPGAELISGTELGTVWRKITTGHHPFQLSLAPWMRKLPGGLEVDTSWQSMGMMWFQPEDLPEVKKTTRVAVRHPWGSQRLNEIEIGIPIQSTIVDRDGFREGVQAGKNAILCARQESFVSRAEALLSHKAYHLDTLKKVFVFWVAEDGSVEYKRGKGYYWSNDLLPLPRRTARQVTRKSLEEKYGEHAVPPNFWRFSEKSIAARAALYKKVEQGELYAPGGVGREDGFVPAAMVSRLTGLPPVADPCPAKTGPRSYFYPKITLDRFFKNQEWVGRLIKEMGREYDWVLVAFLKGKVNLRGAVMTAAMGG